LVRSRGKIWRAQTTSSIAFGNRLSVIVKIQLFLRHCPL